MTPEQSRRQFAADMERLRNLVACVTDETDSEKIRNLFEEIRSLLRFQLDGVRQRLGTLARRRG